MVSSSSQSASEPASSSSPPWRLAYYLGALQWVVQKIGLCAHAFHGYQRSGGAFECSAIFVGQVECQVLIRPYIATLSSSELFTSMAAAIAVFGLRSGRLHRHGYACLLAHCRFHHVCSGRHPRSQNNITEPDDVSLARSKSLTTAKQPMPLTPSPKVP